jgi:hypothetical protein
MSKTFKTTLALVLLTAAFAAGYNRGVSVDRERQLALERQVSDAFAEVRAAKGGGK